MFHTATGRTAAPYWMTEKQELLRLIWLLNNSGIDWEFSSMADVPPNMANQVYEICRRYQSHEVPDDWTQ